MKSWVYIALPAAVGLVISVYLTVEMSLAGSALVGATTPGAADQLLHVRHWAWITLFCSFFFLVVLIFTFAVYIRARK
jgi:heme/copper-type cytochrome/quinol oxidase subunit 2